MSNFTVRPIELQDGKKGFFDVLAQLTSAPPLDDESMGTRLELMKNCGVTTLVVEDTATGRVVACGSLMVEPKLSRGGTNCGHIEDIVVDKAYQGKKLGKLIIDALCEAACANKCYKVILDCSESNEGFYAKCGFSKKEIQMRKDL